MALMTLGLFVFDLPTLLYDQLQQRMTWRHATGDRVGARPAVQFVGEGSETVTISGVSAPVVFGDVGAIDRLKEMGRSGRSWPLVDGAGNVYGDFVIESLDLAHRAILDNGVPKVLDFTLALLRVDDDAPALPVSGGVA